jgi:beta-glucosidase
MKTQRIKFLEMINPEKLSFTALAVLLLVFVCFANCVSGEDKVGEIVKSMTLEQKVQLVIGTGMYFPIPDSIREKMPPGFGGDERTEETTYTRMVDKIRMYLPGSAGVTSEYPEFGITSQTLADGPAGLRISPIREDETNTYYCTAFPIATVLASTWDTDLVENVGKAMGKEVLEYGGDVLLAPALNLQRDPLCGRNFEYYSEDPLLSGKMAAAMVRGIQSNGVGTSIKHFAVNNQETNRMSVDVIVSERALRELYLKGFEIAVKEGKPWTVMSSYNKINGVYASESHDLLTKVLRDDWGFEGYVMTDWGAGNNVVAQMKAGNDMIQPGTPEQIKELTDAVKTGKLDVAVLDKNVGRILEIMMKTPRYKGYKISNKPDLKAHAQVTRRAAAEGMILLENKNNALPFNNTIKHVAAFGNASYDFISGGTGSGDVNEAYTISLMQGLQNAGYKTFDELQETYEKYITETKTERDKGKNFFELWWNKEPVAEMPLDAAIAKAMARKADIALITIGRNAGEGGDREAVEGDLYLTKTEKDLIRTVTEEFHKAGKKAMVILNIAGVIEMASWSSIPDAVLCAWQPGQEGGNSVVDVISGKINPSGKLATSFPVKYEDTPTAKNFPGFEIVQEGAEDKSTDLSGFSFMNRVPWEVIYEEDIYVGYRYYNTFDVPVAYEFGYGKSYTTFEYSNLKLSDNKLRDKITISIEIKNTGKFAGREVVQIYCAAPEGKLEKPEEELVAFGKTALLEPGKSETLTFTIDPLLLASFDESTSIWITEAGEYTLKVGASSKDIKEKESFSVTKDFQVETVTKSLVPQNKFNRFSN